MKLKNVGFIERHVEKFIFMVSLLYVAYVWTFYVAGDTYSVVTQSGPDPVPPQQIEEHLITKAADLLKLISNPKSPLPPVPIPHYTEDFIRRVTQSSINPAQRYEVPWNLPGLDPKVWHTLDVRIPEYVVLPPGLPTGLRATTDYAVVRTDPLAPPNPDLVALIGNKVPMDINYVTVVGDFDLGSWRDEMRKVSDDKRLPEEWIRNSMMVTSVEMERQTWDPSTGAWGPTELLPPMPGASSYKTLPTDGGSVPADVVQTIRLEQDLISRVPFLPVDQKHKWLPPKQDQASPNDVPPTPQPTPNPRPRPDMGGPGGPGGPIGPNGFPGQPFPGGPGGPGGRGPVVPQAKPVTPPPTAKTIDRASTATAKTFDDSGDIRTVWAHDVTVKPGMKYRYRLIATVLNPLFQKSGVILKQRLMYFNLLSLSPKISQDDSKTEWVEVTIPEAQHFFVTASNSTQQTATVEVWHIFNGAWTPQEFTVQAGDPIGKIIDVPYAAGKVSTDLRTNMTVVDITFDTPGRDAASSGAATLLYLDDQNHLKSRQIDADREDPLRQKFRSELPASALESKPEGERPIEPVRPAPKGRPGGPPPGFGAQPPPQ